MPVEKLDFSGIYSINCDNREQKNVGETGRKISLPIKEHRGLRKSKDIERSEIAEKIARTGHESECKSTEGLAGYGEDTRKRKKR
ncbi:unnamed protein product [Protopolystoma xenopodis]|uniref:Uncharacterized protein n=1 Tax=Protopolystoma xenopodis TaxID=117903 RepID=A0A3S5CKQ1_9PLAT|nr:unnamed protein product [Protopolystoma xenopodis]